jgi:hypothetical protein
MNRTMLRALLCLAAISAPLRGGAAQPALAVNQWVKLPDTFPNGYGYSETVYAPGRGQVLHWGAVAYERGVKGGNDVRAFDADTLAWSSDYPSDPGQSAGMTGGGATASAISFLGKGRWLKSNRPYAAMIAHAVTWDTKRRRAVYSMPGLMAAYDAATRTWTDLKATAEVNGCKLPGGPPVYGAGMCYDPVNDEIVMFPHFGAQSADLRSVTGEITGHLGTLRYSYKDNTWRRAGAEFGSEQVRNMRKGILTTLGRISPLLDKVYTLRGHGKSIKELAGAAKAATVPWPSETTEPADRALDHINNVRTCIGTNDANGALREGTLAVWALEKRLDTSLAVEPPRRSVAPMVYDAKNQCIVLFGGDSGRIRPDLKNTIKDRDKLRALYGATDRRLNDTWAYDCKTKQWRNISTDRRPPPQQAPMLHYDPDSGLVLLVTIAGHPYDKRVPRKATLWSLDVAKREWSKRTEQTWDGPIDRWGWYTGGVDPRHKLLLIAHTSRCQQTTWVMKYDLAAMPSAPAPRWTPPPPITPTVIPPDDPAWVAKLKALPTNRWVAAKPPVEPNRRDWGSIACDPVRGWMVYFGGGHSTYQGTDAAIYQVGANRWVHQAGGHNDSLPPVGWGGYHVDAWGANNAGHMRNQYVALDGRMYMNVGFGCQVKPRGGRLTFAEAEVISLPKKPYSWFYDVDRGGVWRQLRTEVDGAVPKPNRGRIHSAPHVVDPAGVIYGFRLDGRRYSNVTTAATVYRYDIYARKTRVISVPKPWPNRWPESRPFCIAPEKGRIVIQDYDSKSKEKTPSRTWVYDIKANKFIDLGAANQPAGRVLGAAYIAGQDAVIAIFNPGGRTREQWVYSFKRNRWQPLPLDPKSGVRFQAPYCQMDYVAKYGVLVNVAGRTYVMRPDIGRLKWE